MSMTARAAVMAVTDTIAAATALTEEEMATLAGMVSAADTSLGAIEDYRDDGRPDSWRSPNRHLLSGQDVLVKALMPTSTAEPRPRLPTVRWARRKRRFTLRGPCRRT